MFELAQIVLGTARGNVLLGAIVRGVRAISALVVLPAMRADRTLKSSPITAVASAHFAPATQNEAPNWGVR